MDFAHYAKTHTLSGGILHHALRILRVLATQHHCFADAVFHLLDHPSVFSLDHVNLHFTQSSTRRAKPQEMDRLQVENSKFSNIF